MASGPDDQCPSTQRHCLICAGRVYGPIKFCSRGCERKWEDMSDAEKAVAIWGKDLRPLNGLLYTLGLPRVEADAEAA